MFPFLTYFGQETAVAEVLVKMTTFQITLSLIFIYSQVWLTHSVYL